MKKYNRYKNYGFEELIEDPQFRKWVFQPSNIQKIFWEGYLQAFPEKKALVTEAREFLLSTQSYFETQQRTEREIEESLEEVLQKVKPTSNKEIKSPIKRRFAISMIRRIAIAASITLVLSLVIWVAWTNETDSIVYATKYGEWKTIELPDGSQVQLNANSTLTILNDWETEIDRKVKLEGEAFFIVSKMPQNNSKFKVLTNDIEVEVLGTMFNVHARGEVTQVYLEEGSINLAYGQEEIALEPGDFIAYSGKMKKVTARHRPKKEETAPDSWKNGIIFFSKEYALPILTKLEEIYGVEIKINNKAIYSKSYTVALPMESLDFVIPILEKSMGVEITQKGKVLLLK